MEENIMNPTTNIEKPKRKYTRRKKTDSEQETIPGLEIIEAEKPKRKYTRRKKADSTEPVESEVVENISKEETEEKPKKRGRKGSTESQAPSVPKGRRKGWSNEQPVDKPAIKEYMYIEIELLREALGMMPSDPNLLDIYIGTKALDKATREEEVAEAGEQDVVDKMTTIWPIGYFYIDENGNLIDKADPFTDPAIKAIANDADCIVRLPYLYDYQIRGMFKDSCGMLWRAKGQNLSSNLKAYKKIIDGGIFVFPRHVAIEVPNEYIDDDGNHAETFDDNNHFGRKQRSMRTNSPSGQYNALASSEVVPAGSHLRFTIGLSDPSFRAYVEEWLDYGLVRGIGQWRNSGTGIFRWRECNSDWTPIE